MPILTSSIIVVAVSSSSSGGNTIPVIKTSPSSRYSCGKSKITFRDLLNSCSPPKLINELGGITSSCSNSVSSQSIQTVDIKTESILIPAVNKNVKKNDTHNDDDDNEWIENSVEIKWTCAWQKAVVEKKIRKKRVEKEIKDSSSDNTSDFIHVSTSIYANSNDYGNNNGSSIINFFNCPVPHEILCFIFLKYLNQLL